jgi:hypothetical protein
MSEFRCTGCGSVAEIEAPDGTLTLGRKNRPIDERAPTCPCGSRSWVLCGSTTEFYAYTGRADVCRFGEHVDARVQSYTLVPSVKYAAREETLLLDSLQVNVCPDHLAELRANGFLGFVLED